MPASTVPSAIPFCPNRGFCTAECPQRPTCPKPRIPLLIPAIVIHYRTGRIYGDEYINDLAQVKQEQVDLACQNLAGHQGVPDFQRDVRSNVKISAI